MVLTLKLLEYWATGTAAVVPKLKAICEVSKDKENVLFFEPGDYEDLAEKITKLLDDKDLLKKVSNGGLNTIKDYDWKKLANEVVDICITSP